MIRKPAGDIDDGVMRQHVEHLQDNSQGSALELTAAPTDAAPLLEDGETGVYSDVYYRRLGSTILVFTPSSTITIT